MSHRDHGSPALTALSAVAILSAGAVAILFPVFAKMHHQGPVWCLSNEKQLGLAFAQYAQDNNGQLPDGAKGGGVGWGGAVYPYVKNPRVYRCPQDTTSGTAAGPVVSYGCNVNAAQHPALEKYRSPSRTVLLFEVAHDNANVAVPDEGAVHGAASFSAAGDGTEATLLSGRGDVRYATSLLGGRPPAPFSQFDPPRHEDGADFLLVDGHVQWLKPADVSAGADAAHSADPQTGTTQGRAAGTANKACAATFSVL